MDMQMEPVAAERHPETAGQREERLRILELEQSRLLARHEAVVAQLGSLRSTLRGMERLMELRMQRLEQLGRNRPA